MTIECLVELSHVFFDKTFTYLVPDSLRSRISIGSRVVVPFGKQTLEGFVMSISYDQKSTDLKEIIDVVDSYPVLNEELLLLGKRLQSMTMSSLMSCYQVMLPRGLKARKRTNINIKMNKYISLNRDLINTIKLNESQLKIVSYIGNKDKVLKEELNKINKDYLELTDDLKSLINDKYKRIMNARTKDELFIAKIK